MRDSTVNVKPKEEPKNKKYLEDEAKAKDLRDNGCTLFDTSLNKPYLATLNLIDAKIAKNIFYKIEIIHSNRIYYLYRTFGEIGTEYVKSQLNEFDEEHFAINKFRELYLKQTGNSWENSLNFEKKPNKYFQVDMNLMEDEKCLEQAVDWDRLNGINLDEGVKQIISTFFDVKKMETQLKEFQVTLCDLVCSMHQIFK